MITLPANFSDFNNRESVEIHTIVKVTDGGSNTWLFADVDMAITSGNAYYCRGMVKGHSGLTGGVNLFSRRFAVGNATITLDNLPYDSDGTRLSDLWFAADLLNGLVEVYLTAGPNVSSLTDAPKVFNGHLTGLPKFTKTEIVLSMEDDSILFEKDAPPRTNADDVGGATGESPDFRLPIVHGDFRTSVVDPFFTGNHLVPVRGYSDYEYIVADHALNSIVGIWVYLPDFESFMRVDDADWTGAEDAYSGHTRSRITLTPDTNDKIDGYVYLRPTKASNKGVKRILVGTSWRDSTLVSVGSLLNLDRVHNPGLAFDGRTDTYAEVLYPLHYGTWAAFEWNDYTPPYFVTLDTTDVTLRWQALVTNPHPAVTVTYGTELEEWVSQVRADLDDEGSAGPATRINGSSNIYDSTVRTLDVSDGSGWDWTTNDRLELSTKGFVARFHVAYLPHVISNFSALKLYEVDLKLRLSIHYKAAVRQVPKELTNLYWFIPDRELTEPMVFAEIKGHEIGTEIGTRQSLTSTDYNEWPNYAIELLLRRHYGYATADIDTDSFDDAWRDTAGSEIKCRFILDERSQDKAANVIQEISESANFCFFPNPSGKARLIALDQPSPTTDVTILWEDLLTPPEIDITPPTQIINRLVYSHDYVVADNKYRQQGYTENATSIDAFDVREGKARWKYLDPNAVDALVDSLFLANKAFFSIVHRTIAIKTKGFRHVDIEPGDWIEVDGATSDSHFQVHAASWSGKQFLVTEKRVTMDSVEFRGIELNTELELNKRIGGLTGVSTMVCDNPTITFPQSSGPYTGLSNMVADNPTVTWPVV